ncbi:hypothetical protein AB9K41_22395 [Cribrihabitans sp. XS_ASV171]
MASFAISFRIGNESNDAERYASLVDVTRDLSEDGTWEETTSFILIKSSKSVGDVASHIYLRSKMRTDLDKLLVMEIGSKRYAAYGDIQYPATLGKFFKN